ncbi:MAG: gliding motility-associated C-terminal domain-containing protein [Flavobacteriales bacterium]|jgi:gliding motility-associated-like protein|nr:gliding motility-associated C-terminal domain-containing protein [Flavobacteriales bacterium]
MAEQRCLLNAAHRFAAFALHTLRNFALVVAALLLWQGEAYATHAMGGDITYECLGNNQYRVSMSFFRDCNGVNAPTSCNNGDLRFNVRSSQCGANFNACFTLQSVQIVTPICPGAVDRCSSPSGTYGVERYRYSAVIDLTPWAACGTDWIIDWDLCCRNNAITSLNNPGSRDLYLSARLNNTVTPCNSSPRFLNDPVPFGCVGQPIVYNHGVSDLAGDSLTFALAPARGTGGATIPYSNGYTFQQPVITSGGANAVTIDPQTGTISFTPSVAQFAVVTVLVTEYRNGVLIGQYTRDLQFAIINCNNNNPSASGINGTGSYVFNVCAGTNFCFNINSTDADAPQNVTMTWNDAIPGATFTTSGGSRPVGTFCWTPTLANLGQQIFTVTVEDDACVLNGTATVGYLINITPPLTPAVAGPDQNVCGFSTTLAGQQPYATAPGVWSVISGTGTFTNAGSPTTGVSGLTTGDNVFRWTVNYATCGTTTDDVLVRAYDPGHPVANAGPDQELCQPTNTATLAGNVAVSPAVGTWTLVSGVGTITSPNSPTSGVTGLGQGTNVFRWTIDNGACTPPTNDQVAIRVYSSAQPAANAGLDQQLCAPTLSTTLAGNAPIAPASGLWTVVSGTAVFANASQRNTAVSGLSIGLNRLRWTISNGPCVPPTTEDMVDVVVFNPASPNANAGPNQQVCATTATLAGNAPLSPATGQWTVVSGAGVFATANSPTSGVSGLAIGANVFQWTLNNGPCANGVTTSQVTITRFDGTAPTANAGVDQDLCSVGATGFASATMAADPAAAPGSGTWTVVGGAGTITTANSPTTTVTNIPVGTTTLRWTISNGPCVPNSSFDEVVIRVFDRNAPIANAGPAQSFCAPVASITLAANAATAPASGTWTVVSGTGIFANANSPTTTVTGAALGVNVYRWTLNNGPCPGAITSSTVSVTLFNPAVANAAAGPDQDLCGTSTATLAGNAVAAPAVGTWTVVSGTATFANANAANTTVTGLPIGTTVLRWTVNNGTCGSTSDDVSIDRFDPNNPVANAGPDQSICIPVAPNLVTMSASSIIAPAVGTWTTISGSGSIANINSPTTQISGLAVGINVFRWTVDNGPCPNGITTDDVRILVFTDSNPIANAGPDQSLCTANGTATMAGSSITSPAVGTWTLVSGTGALANANSPTTSVTGLGVGQNIFQWTVNNGPCANGITSDQMSFFVYDPNNPSANAGQDQNLCTSIGNSITLEGSPVIFPATGVWTVSGGPATIVDPNSPITLVTGLVTGNYGFTWTVNNGVCPDPISSNTSLVVVADGNAQAALAGPDQSVCGTSSIVTMDANIPTGVATASWSVVAGSATFTDATSSSTTASGFSIGVNTLRWSINNGACGITSDLIDILVYDPDHPVANAGPDQQLCTPTTATTLQGSSLTSPTVGQWTLVSGSGTIANPGSPTSGVSGLAIGENVFRWQVNNGACPSPITQDLVSIFVYDNDAPVANAGPDQEICTPVTSITLVGNATVGSAIGTWTRITGTGTITAPNDPNSTVTALGVGLNIFQWEINNGNCGSTTDQVSIFVFDATNPVANAGPDQDLCTPTSTSTLAGSAVIFPASGSWALVSGSGTITSPSDPGSGVTGLAIGENIFEWTVLNGPCANPLTTDRVSIFVFDDENPIADAGPDQEFCTPTSSTTLAGSSVTFPATGMWTLSQGSGVIADPNDPNTAITGLTVGINIFTWIVDNGPCANGITTDEVRILIFDENNPVADAGADQERCTPNTSTFLEGSAVTTPAVGTWVVVSGTAVVVDINDPHSAVIDLSVGETVLEWRVSNGPCANGNTSDQISIFLFDDGNPDADAGPDQELCTPNTITTMAGSTVIFPASGTWTLVSGSGTITAPNDPNTTVTDLGVGENIFAWSVYNGPCANSNTTNEVSIFLFDLNTPPVNAGPDQELCTPNTSTSLAGSPVVFPGVGTWSVVSGGGVFADPNDPNTTVSAMPVGENIYQWTLANGPCDNEGDFDQVSVFIFDDGNPNADAGPDQELCTINTATTQVAGSAVTFPATGEWTLVSGTGTIADPNDPNTTIFDLSIGENIFEWTVDNGPCLSGITTDRVSIFVFDENNLEADAGVDQDLCTPVTQATLSGSAVVFPAEGTWSVLSGTGTITDPNDPNTTITGLGVGTINVRWTVSNGPCTSGVTTDDMVIRLFDEANPAANAGPDQELCSDDPNTTLQGSSVTAPANGFWQLVSGTGTITDPIDPSTAVTDLAIGENIFLWTVSNGPCTNPLTEDLVSIFVFDVTNPDANAGADQQVCTPVTQATMAGSSYTFPATGEWTLVSGAGTIEDPNTPNTVITDLGIGVNVFQWEVYNGGCLNQTTNDLVEIVLFDASAPPADAGPDQEFCAPDDQATLTGNDPIGAAIGTWQLVQGTGVIADPSSPTTLVTDLEVGENIFTWTLQGGICVTTVDSVSLLVFDPENPDAYAGLDQELCMPEDSVLMAGSNLILPAYGTWTALVGGGTPVAPGDPGTLITNISIGLNTFQWEVYNGPCSNSLTADVVDVTLFNDTTAAANAGPDLEQCLPLTDIVLQGEQPPAPAEGTWTLIAGTGDIAEPNNPTSAVTGLSQGINTFVWTLVWDPCPSNGLLSDTMSVYVYDPSAPLANAGPDQQLCSPDNSTVLEGNTPDIPGVGTWSVVSGTAIIAEPNNPTSAVSNLEIGVHVLVYEIYNGMCGFGPPSTDTLTISVYDGEAPPASTGESISACTPTSSVSLFGNTPIFPAIGTWTGSSGTIVDPNDPTSDVTDLGVGQHEFTWTIDNGACGTSSAAQNVFIYDDEAPDADAGPDQELCTPTTSTDLEANAVVFPAVGTWQVIEGTGTFADVADPTTNVTGLSIGTNTFRWNISNGPCGSTQDDVTVTVFDDEQVSANAGPDQELCTPNNSTTLAGSTVAFPAIGTWVFASGTATLSDPNSPTATISDLNVGAVVLQWVVDNGPCTNGTTIDEVTITLFDDNAAVAAAGPDQDFCTPINAQVTMLASAATSPGTGTWSVASGQGTFANPSDPFSVVTNLGLGENIFQWSVSNGPCGSSDDAMSIHVFDNNEVAADAGKDQDLCQHQTTTTTMEAVAITSTGSGSWTLLSGTGAITNANDPMTTVTGLGLGENWFIWTVTNGTCGITSDTVLVELKDCLLLKIPNAFSPNNDGTNDLYVIENLEYYPENSFVVFNRWGNKVFEATPYTNTWDGTNQFGGVMGEELPESTYYYVLDPGTGDEAFTGYIYLRR